MKGHGYAKHQEQDERGQGRKVSMPGHQAMMPVWATGRRVEQEVRWRQRHWGWEEWIATHGAEGRGDGLRRASIMLAKRVCFRSPSQQPQSQTDLQSSNARTVQCLGSAEVHRAHTTGIYIPQVVHGRCPRPPARTRRVHISLRLSTVAKAKTKAGLARASQVPFWSQQWEHRSVWSCRTVCKPASASSSVRSVWDEPPAAAGQHRFRASTLSHQESVAAPRRVLRGSPLASSTTVYCTQPAVRITPWRVVQIFGSLAFQLMCQLQPMTAPADQAVTSAAQRACHACSAVWPRSARRRRGRPARLRVRARRWRRPHAGRIGLESASRRRRGSGGEAGGGGEVVGGGGAWRSSWCVCGGRRGGRPSATPRARPPPREATCGRGAVNDAVSRRLLACWCRSPTGRWAPLSAASPPRVAASVDRPAEGSPPTAAVSAGVPAQGVLSGAPRDWPAVGRCAHRVCVASRPPTKWHVGSSAHTAVEPTPFFLSSEPSPLYLRTVVPPVFVHPSC